ncbi:hypothetical protein Pfo_020425 [Paulownia fortunei]|nr:hypothetical protein Pfo_020425 [Paulownia fortunei]
MIRRGVACDECTKNCETFHQKQEDLSTIVTRFFKIMFGKDYSKVLYLPPQFARTVKHLAGQETQIEDSSGLRWSVTLSYVKGSLAFHKGWNKFFLDHGLAEGEFLVFNYIKRSHFVVQIYGKSACERINFNNGRPRQNKRSRRDPETVSLDEPFQTTDVNSRDKPSAATSVASGSIFENCQTHLAEANADFGMLQLLPISMNMEDPTCMINRDDGYYQREDRNFLHDLSSFEMAKETPDANKFEKALDTKIAPSHSEMTEYANKFEKALDMKIVPCLTATMEQTKTKGDDTQIAMIHKNEINGHSSDIFTDNFDKAFNTKVVPSHTETMEQSKIKGDDTKMAVICSKQITGHSGDIFTDKFHIKPSDNSNLSKDILDDVSNFQNGNNPVLASDSESPSIGNSKIAEREYAVKRRCCESSVSSSVLKDLFGKQAIKKERADLGEEANAIPEVSGDAGNEPTIVRKHGQMSYPVVKVEPDLPYDTVRTVAVSPFSAKVKSQSYLELPVHIPSIPGRRERGRGKVVYLRDSAGRIWPVLYPDIFSVKALTGNWSKFCEQNNIKPGDECRFQVENDMLCIYRVDVTHRSGDFPDK